MTAYSPAQGAPFATGRCACGAVRWSMACAPMIVHACHCTWCQRESGGAFALNALIESDRLAVEGAVDLVLTPSASGKGQEIARCPICRVALYSHYAGSGRLASFVRVGTADEPSSMPPDVHIFTASRQGWLRLDQAARAYEAYYPFAEVWPEPAMARFRAMKAGQGG